MPWWAWIVVVVVAILILARWDRRRYVTCANCDIMFDKGTEVCDRCGSKL